MRDSIVQECLWKQEEDAGEDVSEKLKSPGNGYDFGK